MGPSEFGRTNPKGVLRKEENIGFPKALKRDEIGRLIAETEIAFEINDLSQKIQVLTLNLSGNYHTLKMRIFG